MADEICPVRKGTKEAYELRISFIQALLADPEVLPMYKWYLPFSGGN